MTERVPAQNSDSLRLFFALWPDDTTRDALYRTGKWLHEHWGGRRMRADTLHLTLAFLGKTPVAALDRLVARSAAIDLPGFELVLEQAGYWRHNRIGWFGPGARHHALEALAAAVGAAVRESGLSIDDRPYVPHVTLLRNSAGGLPPACAPVIWPVADFALVASTPSDAGARYDVLQRWRLNGAP